MDNAEKISPRLSHNDNAEDTCSLQADSWSMSDVMLCTNVETETTSLTYV